MNSLSALNVYKHILSADFLFSLSRSRHQREFPFLGIFAFIAVFTTIARLLVNSPGNPVLVGAVAAFVSFWASILFSIVVLVFFGMKAPDRYLAKAVYTTLSSFLVAVVLFDLNLLNGLRDMYWVGQEQASTFFVAILYNLPYTLFCLILSEQSLRARGDRLVTATTNEPQRKRVRRILRLMRGKALASFILITVLSAAMMDYLVLREDTEALQKFLERAVEGILSFSA